MPWEFRLIRGRFFDARDGHNAPPVVIVNETFAHRFFPHENPIGKRINRTSSLAKTSWMPIVGVVGDVKQGELNVPVESEIYTPYEQVSDAALGGNVNTEFRSVKIVVRTANDPVRESSAIQGQVRALDRSLPVTDIKTMETALNESTRLPRFNTLLLGAFAAVAVILAALGIAGVLSYSVAQRISEIGVRLALGARKVDVLKLVLARGFKMAALGTVIGLICSLGITRVLGSLLFETSPLDFWTLLVAPLLLCLVALFSISIPARRAAAVDPIQALRSE